MLVKQSLEVEVLIIILQMVSLLDMEQLMAMMLWFIVKILSMGSLGEEHRQICKVGDTAIKNGIPIIGLNDSGEQEFKGVSSLGGYAEVFQRNVLAQALFPNICNSRTMRWRRSIFSCHNRFHFHVDISSYVCNRS